MTVVLIIFATLLGIAAVGSAMGKLTRQARVMESMHSVGVKDNQIPILAVLELLGAAGLLVGIWFTPIGVLAALGLTLYFLGAVIAHLRAKAPFAEAVPALALAIIALITTILELTR